MANHPKPKILFISESVTLAHFARPFELSNQLPVNDYEIHFACANTYSKYLENSTHTLHQIKSISVERFKQSLANGTPLYDYETLKSYVEEDLLLLDKIKPDLVVGDFRISLAVSARLAKIAYATISNAYWSPYAPERYPVPSLPLTKYLGLTLGGFLFKQAAPIAFKFHALAMQRLKKHYDLPIMNLDLRQVYTEADYTLYADLPSLFPLNNPPENHFFIGPVLWSMPIEKPIWWDHLPIDKPIIYVSMGSSGSEYTLIKIVNALFKENVNLIVSKAGANTQLPKVPNIFIADYLDGISASQKSDMIICNGGSLTCQQAFMFGKPVLGIASNMDQFLNMEGVLFSNSGLVLRSDTLSEKQLLKSFHEILNSELIKMNAGKVKEQIEILADLKKFSKAINSITNTHPRE